MNNTDAKDRELNLDDFIEQSKERKKEKDLQHSEMTLREYVDLIKEDPLICQNASSRLMEIIESYGIEEIPKEERWLGATKRYKLFSDELFGVDAAIEKAVDHFINGKRRTSSGKYVLVLVGPTSSGKSTFTEICKRALERTIIHPVFAIKGCPIHEEPLHAPPRSMTYRAWDPKKYPKLKGPIEDYLKIPPIEGDLCPVCLDLLNHKDKLNGQWEKMPVESFTFSINSVRGISSFMPGDDLSDGMNQLIGRENIGITQHPDKGYNHPRAFELNGEIENANRGFLEGEELLKAKSEILRVFISLAEEKRIKVQGSKFPHIYIDEVIVGHCNLKEFKEYSANQANAAFHDRVIVVPSPYTLRIKDEVKIYKKLIEKESEYKTLKNVHIPEATYLMAATFAELTRVNDSNKWGIHRLTKLKLYNGEPILLNLKDEDKKTFDYRALMEEFNNLQVDIEKREGMFGVSYRDVLAALNNALARIGEKGCLTPLTAIKALRQIFEQRMGYSPEEIARFHAFLNASGGHNVMSEYHNYVIETVQKAFIQGYADLKESIKKKYLAEVDLHRRQTRKYVKGFFVEIERDASGKPLEPDYKLMKKVERHMGYSESQADGVRGEIQEVLGKDPSKEYEPLDRAVEALLIEDNKGSLILLFDETLVKTGEQNKKVQEVFAALEGMGCCAICRKEFCEEYYKLTKN